LWGDVAALKRLARWCRRYGPFVGLEETEAPESLLIDVTGSAHLFHGEESLGRCVLRELAHVGLTAYVAIADTIGAAWAAAFCAARRHSPSPIVIPPGGQTAALESWPVEALRLAPSVVETLRELDLRTPVEKLRSPRRRNHRAALLARTRRRVLRRPRHVRDGAERMIEVVDVGLDSSADVDWP